MNNQDFMIRLWHIPEGNSDPQRVVFHSEQKERGFYHDDNGEPFEFWIEWDKELDLDRNLIPSRKKLDR